VIEEKFCNYLIYRYFDKSINNLRDNYRLNIDKDSMYKFIYQMQQWLLYFQKDNQSKLSTERYSSIEENIIDNLFSIIVLNDQMNSKIRFDINRARKILEDNIDSIYSINDLIDELNVSARTLQYNFKEKIGITPKQYLHNLRLNAIRKELLDSNYNKVNISEIALKYGFFYHSHFSFEYKKLFGQTPTQTLMRSIKFPLPKLSKEIF